MEVFVQRRLHEKARQRLPSTPSTKESTPRRPTSRENAFNASGPQPGEDGGVRAVQDDQPLFPGPVRTTAANRRLSAPIRLRAERDPDGGHRAVHFSAGLAQCAQQPAPGGEVRETLPAVHR